MHIIFFTNHSNSFDNFMVDVKSENLAKKRTLNENLLRKIMKRKVGQIDLTFTTLNHTLYLCAALQPLIYLILAFGRRERHLKLFE